MKFLLFIYLFLSTFYYSQTKAKIVGIKDGDTVVALLDGNIQKTLRLADVDCPENGQPFGKNAKQYTSDQVFGKQITFTPTDEDRYGRTIAKIYYDGKYLSEEIIKAGFGWWYFKYSKDKNLGDLQKKAMENNLGLWQDKNPIAPWDYRQQVRNTRNSNQ